MKLISQKNVLREYPCVNDPPLGRLSTPKAMVGLFIALTLVCFPLARAGTINFEVTPQKADGFSTNGLKFSYSEENAAGLLIHSDRATVGTHVLGAPSLFIDGGALLIPAPFSSRYALSVFVEETFGLSDLQFGYGQSLDFDFDAEVSLFNVLGNSMGTFRFPTYKHPLLPVSEGMFVYAASDRSDLSQIIKRIEFSRGLGVFNPSVVIDNLTFTTLKVPEPNTVLLVGLSLMILIRHSRNRTTTVRRCPRAC